MQKQEFSPLSSLKSAGDHPATLEELEQQEEKTYITSPFTASSYQRKISTQSLGNQRRRQPVQEITEQLYRWNSFLTKKFEKSQLND